MAEPNSDEVLSKQIETYSLGIFLVILFATLIFVALTAISVRKEFVKLRKQKEEEEKTPETLTIVDPE
ncbi:unnamed protein product [Bursaphelenchus xylophilus]|uniref:(pine wood nematode) hypothetical protein n=1 Tax=Bursaphelenchus xylophilus TaxID=6326 RepID=A0A1I7S2H9_BURXY|nr:unnamed protein product [Bursaphelenchus xylophilus]CAG9121942.1 unnamed protein product [Bursaphelenchus xylophilus]